VAPADSWAKQVKKFVRKFNPDLCEKIPTNVRVNVSVGQRKEPFYTAG
jgi:hypothetical protein